MLIQSLYKNTTFIQRNSMLNYFHMRSFLLMITGCVLVFISCSKDVDEKSIINQTLNQWHEAAAQADFKSYFELMTEDAVFIGTDATERWNKATFQTYAKPHFDNGKAWKLTSLKRTIYIDKDGKIAWFDELLDTSFKICRGSGVLVKTKDGWKVKHYVLSLTIPNELSKKVVTLKDSTENVLIQKLKSEYSKK